MRLRIFHATLSILIMSVLLFFVACGPQGSGAAREALEESPSPIAEVATETASISAAVLETAAEATLTATPAAPSAGRQSTATLSAPSPKRQSTATPPTATPTATPVPTIHIDEGPGVTIGDVTFGAELAYTADLRTKGLSERDGLDSQTGMLFIFDDGRASAFWMKGMRFPLDFVWIGHDCTVVAVTENVPNEAPGTPNSALPLYRSFVEAEYHLEINAGEVEKLGIGVGDSVTFEQINVEGANC